MSAGILFLYSMVRSNDPLVADIQQHVTRAPSHGQRSGWGEYALHWIEIFKTLTGYQATPTPPGAPAHYNLIFPFPGTMFSHAPLSEMPPLGFTIL